jgi:hypothetical protein
MLLFKLPALLPLLSVDPVTFILRQHFLVLDAELAAHNFEPVHLLDHNGGVFSRGKIGERKTPEDALVKVVVESVRLWEVHRRHETLQNLLSALELYVFYNDGGGYELFSVTRSGCCHHASGVSGHACQVMLTSVHAQARVEHL